MATRPTPGASAGTYGTELNAHLAISLASDGKILDGAVFSTSAAPTVDAGVANKKYVDDQNVDQVGQIKGWALVEGDGTLTNSYNVTSSVKDSLGEYTVTWDTNFSGGNYIVVGSTRSTSFRNLVVPTTLAGSCTITIRTDADPAVKADARFMIMAIGGQ